MRTILHSILCLLAICSVGAGQTPTPTPTPRPTIKTLGYNSTNGQVVANTGTNVLKFTNSDVQFSTINSDYVGSSWFFVGDGVNAIQFETEQVAATTRANLGLGWSALTNTNAATSLLGFTTNGRVVANTGTNVLTFTNDVKFGGGELSIETQNISGGNVSFSFEDGFFGGPLVIASNSTITFLGNVAATTRANLGFSTNLNTLWTATNVTNFRTDIGLGSNNSVQFSNVFITNSQAGNATNYLLSIGSPTTGFSGVGGPVGSVSFRANGVTIWTASDTSGFSFSGATVSQPITLLYGGGNSGAIAFGGVDPATGRAVSRTNLGLGSGITTNRTFVSYNGTNYTTNTVTISNGIITGWTQ